MKIALVTHRVHRHGGVPQYVASLATALALDHEVTVFSGGFEEMEDTTVHHHKVRALWANQFIQSVTFSVASSLLLFLSLLKRAGRFEIIHTHGPYAAFTDVNTSHFCEAEEVERMRHQRTGVTLTERLQHRGTALLERGVVKQFHGKPLIVLSERMKREFISHYGLLDERLFVIPGGVDCAWYSPANISLYRDEIRRRHSVAMTDTLVLFLGGDWERKGLSQAIKALSRLRSSEVTMLVVGRGDTARYRELARKAGIARRVIFAGPTLEARQYYAASDIFLLPTLNEPFGLSVLEAMASGLAVLTSREAGVSELIRDGSDVLLLDDPRDVAAISAKLDLLVDDAELRKCLSQRARQTAMGLTWAHTADRTVDVYQQALRVRRN